MPEIAARGLVVQRGGVRVLAGVDISIAPGELVAVMGGTGAGKSTLALALAGLLPQASGSVHGVAEGHVRVVLQRPEATFLAETVLDEVALAPRARGEPDAVAQRHALAWLEALGLEGAVAARDPLTLSGGEQRRVAVAAALAAEARVLVLDEPSAGLDRTARARLHAAIARLHAAGRTVVLVTHDPDEAATLATRLVVLHDGIVAWDGGVEAVLGDPQRASALGLRAAPEVELLHDVAQRRGLAVEGAPASAAAAIVELARIVRTPRRDGGSAPCADRSAHAGRGGVSGTVHRVPLTPLVDARVRVVATALAMVAALASRTLLAAAVVLVATALVVACARVDRVRLRLAVRPLVLLTILLVGLQLLFGGDADTLVRRGGASTDIAAAPALLRAMQASAVVLVTLVLSDRTTTLDLATALRRLLAPLRLVGISVATLAFVVATGLGLVPAMADELERLRLAQRARGLRSRDPGLVSRLRADAMLTAPLFVAAFRRAHLLADALAVRGIDPRRPLDPWRAMVVPSADVLLLAGGIALAFVARFA